MDFRGIFNLVCISINFAILVLGSKILIPSQVDAEYRHALKDLVTDSSSLFFEYNHFVDYQCLGPMYQSSEVYEQVSRLRKRNLFPRVGFLRLDNDDQKLLAVKNIISFEEAQILNKELSLMGVFYFASPVEDGYRVFIDAFDAGSGSEKMSDAKIQLLASMGIHLERVQISRPKIIYLLVLENAQKRSISLEGEKHCKGIA